MKISKIFHTLYGFLMCLPIISILFVCVYVSVNPNAKDSYSGTEIQYRQVEYQTNEVNSIDDLVIGNVYKISISISIGTSTVRYDYGNNTFNLINDKYFDNYVVNQPIYKLIISYEMNEDQLTRGSSYLYGYVSDYIGTNPIWIYAIGIGNTNTLQLNVLYNGNFTNTTLISTISSADLSLIPPQYEEVEVQKLDNAFYYSVNEINDNPLFSWAQNSYLVAPITYVVSLFGMTNNSPIVTMLSYWLTISIIWLVFDLIMYIPLLVHRWIDKGVVE